MAGHEHEAEEIVPDLLIELHVQAFLCRLDSVSDLFVLALERFAATDRVDGSVLRGTHKPRSRPVRHPF